MRSLERQIGNYNQSNQSVILSSLIFKENYRMPRRIPPRIYCHIFSVSWHGVLHSTMLGVQDVAGLLNVCLYCFPGEQNGSTKISLLFTVGAL